MSTIIDDFGGFGKDLVLTFNLGQKLQENIAGQNDYDLPGISDEMFLNIDNLYRESSFLSADIKNNSNIKTYLPSSFDIDNLRIYLSNARILAKEMPKLLGADKKVNYILAMQDTNELRPTGGLLSSIGVFTFENGRLTGKTFFDPGSADKLLRGHVDPPLALKKYLGQSNWSLRDSNWDPDFRTSAPKIEWFLQNEMSQTADGVIAISADNFGKINNLNILEMLKNKDIQIFSNDGNIADTLNNLNWDGGVDIPTCSGNCFVNWLGLVEANLGNNKVNPQIIRNSNLSISATSNLLENRLEVNYKNLSKTDSYRTYLRVMAPPGAVFEKASENINGDIQTLSVDISQIAGRTEGGVLMQVPAGGNAQVVFVWQNRSVIDYNKSGKILLYVSRQAGVPSIPTNITFNNLVFNARKSYNTNLSRDFKEEIKW